MVNRSMDISGATVNPAKRNMALPTAPQGEPTISTDVHSFQALINNTSPMSERSSQPLGGTGGQNSASENSQPVVAQNKRLNGIIIAAGRFPSAALEGSAAFLGKLSGLGRDLTDFAPASNLKDLPGDKPSADQSVSLNTILSGIGQLPNDPAGLSGSSAQSTVSAIDTTSTAAPIATATLYPQVTATAQLLLMAAPVVVARVVDGSQVSPTALDGTASPPTAAEASKSLAVIASDPAPSRAGAVAAIADLAIAPVDRLSPPDMQQVMMHSEKPTLVSVTARERHLAMPIVQSNLGRSQIFAQFNEGKPLLNDTAVDRKAIAASGLAEVVAPQVDAAPSSQNSSIRTAASGLATFPQPANTAQSVDAAALVSQDENGLHAGTGANAVAQQVLGSIKTQIETSPAAVPEDQPGKASAPSELPPLSNPVRVLVVHLEPAEMGVVKVHLSLKGNELSVKLEADTAGTAALLDRSRGSMADDLRAAGHVVGDIGVSRSNDSLNPLSSIVRTEADGQGAALPGGSMGLQGGSSGRGFDGQGGNRPAQQAVAAAVAGGPAGGQDGLQEKPARANHPGIYL